jgi:hypothetical protein
MIETIKTFRRKLVGHNPAFLGWPIVFAIVAPNMIQPFWFWRLLACFVAGLALIAICTYGLIVPEQIFHDLHSDLRGNKRRLFLALYIVLLVAAICLTSYFFVVPPGGDLYRVLNNSTHALDSQQMLFANTQRNSAWFMYQRLYAAGGTEYALYFDFQAFGPGTYSVLYSPYTKIIYDISPAKDAPLQHLVNQLKRSGAAAAAPGISGLRAVAGIVFLRLEQDYLAVDRQRIKVDGEAFAGLDRPCGADLQPEGFAVAAAIYDGENVEGGKVSGRHAGSPWLEATTTGPRCDPVTKRSFASGGARLASWNNGEGPAWDGARLCRESDR